MIIIMINQLPFLCSDEPIRASCRLPVKEDLVTEQVSKWSSVTEDHVLLTNECKSAIATV